MDRESLGADGTALEACASASAVWVPSILINTYVLLYAFQMWREHQGKDSCDQEPEACSLLEQALEQDVGLPASRSC